MSRFSEELNVIPRPARIIAVVAALLVPFAALCFVVVVRLNPTHGSLAWVPFAALAGRCSNADGLHLHTSCRLYRRGFTPAGDEALAVGFACDLHTQRHRYHSVLHSSGSSASTLHEVWSQSPGIVHVLRGLWRGAFKDLPRLPGYRTAGLVTLRTMWRVITRRIEIGERGDCPQFPYFLPAMIAVAGPIAFNVDLTIVARCDPSRARIRRASPISIVPSVPVPVWIPVPIDPNVVWCRPSRNHPDNRWRRRWSDPETKRHLAERRFAGKQHHNHQRSVDKFFHIAVLLTT